MRRMETIANVEYKLVDGLVRPVIPKPEKPLQYVCVCRKCGYKNILKIYSPFDTFCWECGELVHGVDGIAFEKDYVGYKLVNA